METDAKNISRKSEYKKDTNLNRIHNNIIDDIDDKHTHRWD